MELQKSDEEASETLSAARAGLDVLLHDLELKCDELQYKRGLCSIVEYLCTAGAPLIQDDFKLYVRVRQGIRKYQDCVDMQPLLKRAEVIMTALRVADGNAYYVNVAERMNDATFRFRQCGHTLKVDILRRGGSCPTCKKRYTTLSQIDKVAMHVTNYAILTALLKDNPSDQEYQDRVATNLTWENPIVKGVPTNLPDAIRGLEEAACFLAERLQVERSALQGIPELVKATTYMYEAMAAKEDNET